MLGFAGFGRLSRTLFDPAHADPDGFVAKARALFAEETARSLDDPALSLRVGRVLGHDLGQMRVQFNWRDYVIEPAKAKVEMVDDLRELVGQAQAAILADYRGLSVAELTDLRKKLRETPPREVLSAQMLGSLNGPISGLVGTLNGILSNFVFTLQAIADKQGGGDAETAA